MREFNRSKPHSFQRNNGGGRFGRPSSSRFGKPARRGFSGENIAHTRYVKKAAPIAEQPEFTPKHTFNDFGFPEIIARGIEAKGYTKPTPIQDEAMGPIMEGRDVVAIANTGTGKTATFLLPILSKMFTDRRQKALVLIPTRELAVQVDDELRAFSRNMQIRSVLTMGGASITQQMHLLRKNPQFVIATPGRLKDLINRRAINLADFHTVVLDEVDRMVDIGFLPDVRMIVSHLAEERQSLFFSATVTPEIDSVIRTFAKDPVKISVRTQETAATIDQDVVKVEHGKEKLWKLFDIARDRAHNKILVFVRTKRGADQLSNDLYDEGFHVAAIHGDRSQGQRTRALADFKMGKIRMLVATDVAARGIDIPDVSLVINYDEPGTYADYVHRIGRTGRAGKAGKALTFVVGR